jgi:hypothetical protein
MAQDEDSYKAAEANDAGLEAIYVSASSVERLSPYFTILAAAFGLISDGYQNHLMTMSNVGGVHNNPKFGLLGLCRVQVVFRRLYPMDYTSSVSTRVSNALLVGELRRFAIYVPSYVCLNRLRQVLL